MRMTERPLSIPDLEEPVHFGSRNGQTPDSVSKRGSDKSGDPADSPLSASTDSGEVRQPVTKPPTAKLPLPNDIVEGQPSLRQSFHHIIHSSGTSRNSSTRTSSSSLQALNEDTVVDARSERGLHVRPSLPRRISRQSDGPPAEYPVYPDQSYASLQSQVHPTYQPPFLSSRSSYPSHTDIPVRILPSRAARTVGNTPVSSPGLFSVRSPRSTPFGSDDEGRMSSPFLHPTHLQPPKETHTAEVDRDTVTGNKLINQYEILEELGRGEHGKVKLGRHVDTRQQVAIKIVQRYSKRRRLGKLGNPEDKVKKEVAILKKARHPNVVSLLEVIDDPNRQKVYIVLEYVENGEIIWRRKGLREIIHVDKQRLEREKAGMADSPSFLEESQHYVRTAKHLRRQREKARERAEAHAASAQERPIPAWSLEHGAESDEETESEAPVVRISSRSMLSPEDAHSSPSHSFSSAHESVLAAVEGSMYGPYSDDRFERRFSTASSSFGYAPSEPEWSSNDDDMSYVPCLTINEARNAFRDSLLGVEYLHYQGIIHRDIKPANLLLTSNHRVKISDFGVSYLGRPMRDEEEEQLTETQATELDDARELSKTVGTPAFYAPELCYTGEEFVDDIGSVPRITGAIDVWSLGVTLYGMVFGRLPFVSDDEYSMFQTIVKKEVFIPRKRLKPIEDDPDTVSQWPRNMSDDKRMEDELAYEDIDDELFDLLKRLLTKDPVKRITVKEIKHHPWVFYGLPNPRAWVEETDPGYQSKGKRIEVSSEEVTSAVSKVPFIQRVRSNVAKWSNYLTGRSKDKDSRKRSSLTTPSVESLTGSNGIGKYLWDSSRRGSLKGDEDIYRPSRHTKDGEHPLSQSVTASPVGREEQTSYFVPQDIPSHDRSVRPSPPDRATSTLSTAESAKTLKPSDTDPTPLTQRRFSPPTVGETSGTTNVGGLFGGASRRLARGLHSGDWRADKSVLAETASLDGDRRCEPSLALSVASAVGQMQNSGLESPSINGGSSLSSVRPGLAHRRHLSYQLNSSSEPFHLTKEALLRQRKSDPDNIKGTEPTASKVESDPFTNGSLHLRHVPPVKPTECPVSSVQLDSPNPGLTTSPPSAATISSSSADDYTSMSQSASHPSIPSVVSGASSLSGDGFYGASDKEKDNDPSMQVPSILRTGETVKARQPSPQRSPDDDESKYYCDDENESESDSEDEGLMIGKKKTGPQKAALRVGQKS